MTNWHVIVLVHTVNMNQEKEATGDSVPGARMPNLILGMHISILAKISTSKSPQSSYDAVRQWNIEISSTSS